VSPSPHSSTRAGFELFLIPVVCILSLSSDARKTPVRGSAFTVHLSSPSHLHCLAVGWFSPPYALADFIRGPLHSRTFSTQPEENGNEDLLAPTLPPVSLFFPSLPPVSFSFKGRLRFSFRTRAFRRRPSYLITHSPPIYLRILPDPDLRSKPLLLYAC